MKQKSLWVGLLVGFWFCLTWLGWTPTAAAFSEEQKLLLQSWRLVNQSYLDDTFNHQNWWQIREQFLRKNLNDRAAAYTAIEQMLATLDEPFTRLLRPDQYHNLQISTTGELSGVGLQININPDTGFLEIVAPLPGSPAEAARLKTRDRILSIDGIDTTRLTLDEAAARMRGPAGTKVSLTVLSNGAETSQTVELTRQRIALSPVIATLDRSTDPPVGYVRLNQFSANAAKEVADAVTDLKQQGAKAYILDLRNNPGGLLQAGIEIARMWIDEGTIVYTVNRQGISDSFSALGNALTDAPLAVLVNQGTASASEILAGALQDNHRAILIGEKTFGKGLIQSLFELPDGAGLAVTVAKYETPAHHDIHKVGIVPDRPIAQEPIAYAEIGTEVDHQYKAAIEFLTRDTILAKAS
ncbi:carboxyl-terminal processing protease CtpA [Pannus brasiliensis CCIBt3594]|uniref:C-terminal processing peptidase n=1 Tax=Pannus brasiliensis CCIBt3594 TaxID=1427578 RepID=A0AAW9QTI5_9CHRO